MGQIGLLTADRASPEADSQPGQRTRASPFGLVVSRTRDLSQTRKKKKKDSRLQTTRDSVEHLVGQLQHNLFVSVHVRPIVCFRASARSEKERARGVPMYVWGFIDATSTGKQSHNIRTHEVGGSEESRYQEQSIQRFDLCEPPCLSILPRPVISLQKELPMALPKFHSASPFSSKRAKRRSMHAAREWMLSRPEQAA